MECPRRLPPRPSAVSGCLLTCSAPQSVIKLQDYRTQLSDRPPALVIALLLRTADLSTEACFSQTLVRWMSWPPQAWSETRNQSLRRIPSSDDLGVVCRLKDEGVRMETQKRGFLPVPRSSQKKCLVKPSHRSFLGIGLPPSSTPSILRAPLSVNWTLAVRTRRETGEHTGAHSRAQITRWPLGAELSELVALRPACLPAHRSFSPH